MNPAEFKKLYLLELQKIESRQEGPDETTKHILNFIETVTENYSSDEIKEIVKEMPELAEGYIARLKQHLVRCAGNEGFIHYTTLIRFTSAAEQGTLAKTLGLNLMQDPILLQRTLTSHEAATNFYKEYNTTHPLPPTQYPSQLLEKGLYDYWNEEQKKQGKIHIALDHINGISLTSPIEPLQFIKTFETNQAKNRSQQNLKNKRLELQMTDPTGPNLRAQLSLCRSQQQYQHTRLYFIVNHIINTRRLVAQLKELEETAQRNQKDIEKLLEKLPQLLSELETKKQEYQERSKKLQDIAQQIKEKEMLELEVLRLCEKQEKELLRTLSLHPKISSETTSETANLTQDPRSSSSFTTQSLPHQASHNTQQEAYPQKFENKPKKQKTNSTSELEILNRIKELEKTQSMRESSIARSQRKQIQEKQNSEYNLMERHQKQHEKILENLKETLIEKKEEILKKTKYRYTSNRANIIIHLQQEPPALQSEKYLQYLQLSLTKKTKNLGKLQKTQEDLNKELTQANQNAKQPSQSQQTLSETPQKITTNEKRLEIKTLELEKIKQLTEIEKLQTKLKQEEMLDLETNQLSLLPFRNILTSGHLQKEKELQEKMTRKNKKINEAISKIIKLFNKFETLYKEQLASLPLTKKRYSMPRQYLQSSDEQTQQQEETPSIHPALSSMPSSFHPNEENNGEIDIPVDMGEISEEETSPQEEISVSNRQAKLPSPPKTPEANSKEINEIEEKPLSVLVVVEADGSDDENSLVNSHQESRKRFLSDPPEKNTHYNLPKEAFRLPITNSRSDMNVGSSNFLYFLQNANSAPPSSSQQPSFPKKSQT